VERCEKEAADINKFASSDRDSVLENVRIVKINYERDEQSLVKFSLVLDTFAKSIKERIANAEARNITIRRAVDNFFEHSSQ
jgi:hypothetical protein